MNELMKTFITALIMVESSGNPDAVGDDGNAIGVLQMHKVMVDEANRCRNMKKGLPMSTILWDYRDRFDPTLSQQMAVQVLKFRTEVRQRVSGAMSEDELITYWARLWNPGAGMWYEERIRYAMGEKYEWASGFADCK